MQYKNYIIEQDHDSIMIKNSDNIHILAVPSEEEAKLFIDDLSIDKELEKKLIHLMETNEYMQMFYRYCLRLPDHCFISSHLATTDKVMLKKYIQQFEQLFNVNISTDSIYKGGETFYTVIDIIPN